MGAPYIQTFETIFYVPAVARNDAEPLFQIYATTDAPGGSVDGIKLVPRLLELEVQLLTAAECELALCLTTNTSKGTPTAWQANQQSPKIGGTFHTANPNFTNESICPIASGHALEVFGSATAPYVGYTVAPLFGRPLRRISLPANIGNNQIICFPDEGEGTTGFYTESSPPVPANGPGIQLWGHPPFGSVAATPNPEMIIRARWQEVPPIPDFV